MTRRLLAAALLCGALTVGGCPKKAEVTPGPVTLPSAPVPSPLRGTSVQGRPLSCLVYGRGPDTLLVIGGIHGGEPAGAVLARQLCTYLEGHPELLSGRRVVVMAEANPDGLAAGRRTNAHGVDVNRNFPSANYAPGKTSGQAAACEPETSYLVGLMDRYRPGKIVTIHQPLTCIDYDGPARGLAVAMSHLCRLPVRKLGAKSGSLGSYAGVDRDVPIVTLELPKRATTMGADAVWKEFGRTLLLAVRYRVQPPERP